MSTRRGAVIHSQPSEAARRQLMLPVPCWEEQWVVPPSAPPGSTLKVLMWVKTDKKQEFSDDEDAGDVELAPLPDEPEIIADDDEADEPPAGSEMPTDAEIPPTDPNSRAVSITAPTTADINMAETRSPSPKPHPLSISHIPDDEGFLGTGLDSGLGGEDGMAVDDGLGGIEDAGEEQFDPSLAMDSGDMLPGDGDLNGIIPPS